MLRYHQTLWYHLSYQQYHLFYSALVCLLNILLSIFFFLNYCCPFLVAFSTFFFHCSWIHSDSLIIRNHLPEWTFLSCVVMSGLYICFVLKLQWSCFVFCFAGFRLEQTLFFSFKCFDENLILFLLLISNKCCDNNNDNSIRYPGDFSAFGSRSLLLFNVIQLHFISICESP